MTTNTGLNIFAQATDSEIDVKGVEQPWRGATVIVARAGNIEYNKYISKQFELHRQVLENESSPAAKEFADKKAQEITLEAFCKFILVGWNDFVGKDGKPYKYTLPNCREVCKLVPDLVRDVNRMSGNDEVYNKACLKKDAETLGK